ncbi:MAG: PKD domain-containing protein [Bacteroidia bacterium]
MKTTILFSLIIITSLTPFALTGQSSSQNNEEKLEMFYEKLESQNILQFVQTTTGALAGDVNAFSIYYQDTTVNDINKFTTAVSEDIISTNAGVIEYSDMLKRKYLSLFNTFMQIKKEYPATIEEFTTRSHGLSLPACNTTPCDNIGFENGTLSGWTGCYAQNTSTNTTFSTSAPVCTGPYGAVTQADYDPTTNGFKANPDYQLEIMSGTGTDPITGYPVVCPNGGKYSCRIGDSTVAGSQVAILENTFLVTPATCNFTYYYSVILQNPNHKRGQQPLFNLTMFDQNGDTIPFCGQYAVVSGPGLPGYDSVMYNSAMTYYKPWTTVFLPLQKYIGQCVSVKVEVSDCEPGGHFGYAYFDAECSPLNIITSSPSICGSPITLTAPSGAALYKWTGPCIIGNANTQTISIGCAGKYTVVLASIVGATCMDTLDTVIVGSTGSVPVPDFKSNIVCLGSPTQFTNLTSGGGANTYSWNFGDPASGANDSSSVANPTHTYPAAGTYTVTLNALSGGCGGDTSFTVVVNSPPVADFKATAECLNNPTIFTNTSVGATSWNWNFGEPASGANNVSTLENPTHTYASSGIFIVTLIAQGSSCTDTSIVVVTVNPLPNVSFTYDTVCSGKTTSFTDGTVLTNGMDTSWSWNFGDPVSGAANISGIENPSHTFSGPGAYSVILTVTTSMGCQGSFTLPVVVSSVPVAAFKTVPVCQGEPSAFTDLSTGSPTIWNWSFGDGTTSTFQNPMHIYAQPGTYYTTLIVSNGGGCTDSVTGKVVVNPMPVARFTADTVCLGLATSFTDKSTIDSGGTISSYSWVFGDGGISVLQNPVHTYTLAGTYNAVLIVTSNSGCDSTYKLPVVVNPLPAPNFTANSPCKGSATVFTNGSDINSGSMANWKWSFGDGDSSTIESPSTIYPAAGTYNVVLVVTSTNGCVDSIKKQVTVNPNPVVSFTANDTAGCVPLCVLFTDNSTISSGSITSEEWNFGDSAASAKNDPGHCYTTVGTFPVTLTVTSGEGCHTTWTREDYITTHPIPVANFVASPNQTSILTPTINFTDRSGGNPVSWYWTYGDNLDSLSHEQNTIHTYKDTGTFDVTLIIANKFGCVDSIKEPVTIEPEWTLYIPNAFTPNGDGINDGFTAKGTNLLSYEMYIYDRWGLKLYQCNDINQPWNGCVQNSTVPCQEDTYIYIINVTDVFHHEHKYIGSVTLLR